MIVEEGRDEILRAFFQKVTVVGTDWYIGMCNQTPAATDTLTSITTEPTSQGGYARQTVAVSALGFPTLFSVGAARGIRSAAVTFAASGNDFSRSFTRLFLATTVDNTGVLIGYTAPLAAALLITDGNNHQAAFEVYQN